MMVYGLLYEALFFRPVSLGNPREGWPEIPVERRRGFHDIMLLAVHHGFPKWMVDFMGHT